jgi:hypothetical protein
VSGGKGERGNVSACRRRACRRSGVRPSAGLRRLSNSVPSLSSLPSVEIVFAFFCFTRLPDRVPPLSLLPVQTKPPLRGSVRGEGGRGNVSAGRRRACRRSGVPPSGGLGRLANSVPALSSLPSAQIIFAPFCFTRLSDRMPPLSLLPESGQRPLQIPYLSLLCYLLFRSSSLPFGHLLD